MEKQELKTILQESVNLYQEGLMGGVKTAGKRFGSKISDAFKEVKEDYRKGSKAEDIKKMMDLASKHGFKCIPEDEYKELTKKKK